MIKVSILIDGGYFLKRLPSLKPKINVKDPVEVDKLIGTLVYNHLEKLNKTYTAPDPHALLYRCFYYDARPYMEKGHYPISKKTIDYSKTPEAQFRLELFKLLRKRHSFAVRLGEVRKERSWILSEEAQKGLLNKTKTVDDLTDADFHAGLRQKAVDMRIGIDIASLTLKKQADTLILVAGDSDFVPAAKLARREGVRFILDPLWRSVTPDLFEHIDGLTSGLPKPKTGHQATV